MSVYLQYEILPSIFWAFFGGVVAGFVYIFQRVFCYLVRTLSKSKCAENVIAFINDFSFPAISAVLLLLSAHQSSEGHIRWYSLLAFILGCILFCKTAGKLLFDIIKKVVDFCIFSILGPVSCFVIKKVKLLCSSFNARRIYKRSLGYSERIKKQIIAEAEKGFKG